ncbi:MAG TPA: CYTH and CHAD domain-containing protein [Mycobacteriales bacterium]|nr:CYTH and CHAD domain-containing protein [Mycobacteriales bacterium]
MSRGNTGTAEIEDKFDVDEDFVLPDLDSLDGVDSVADPVEQELNATYFDTAELRLSTAGMAVRRRTGGTDEGWHVKLPVDSRTRTEVRRPLGRAVRKVPKPLVDQVRAHVRDSELVPIVRIHTRRLLREVLDGDGAVLAQISDDRVTAEVLGHTAEIRSWREIEVELAGADAALLDAVGARLRAAGARPSSAASKLARSLGDRLSTRASVHPVDSAAAGAVVLRYLRDQVGVLLRTDPDVRTDQPDSVHQMRVAARRLRSVLKAYRPLFDPEVINPIRDELQWFGGVLSPARDAEVQQARFEHSLAALPAESILGPVAARITSEYRGRYQRALAELRETMNGVRYFRLLDELEDLVTKPPFAEAAGRSSTKLLVRHAHKADRSARRAVRAAEADELDTTARLERRHEARKAAKRARYAAEAIRPVHRSTAKAIGKSMRAVQRTLGEHRDAVLAAIELRHHAIAAHRAGENSFTYGLLAAREEWNAAAALAEYARAGKRIKVAVRTD